MFGGWNQVDGEPLGLKQSILGNLLSCCLCILTCEQGDFSRREVSSCQTLTKSSLVYDLHEPKFLPSLSSGVSQDLAVHGAPSIWPAHAHLLEGSGILKMMKCVKTSQLRWDVGPGNCCCEVSTVILALTFVLLFPGWQCPVYSA